MEDAQRNYKNEEEVKGLNISLANEETNSNGHRSRVELVEMIEIMKRLRMDVKIYKDNNERIIISQEDKNHIST